MMLVFVRIYVPVTHIEKGNSDWEYVASTADPVTSRCHMPLRIYKVLKLQ